MIPRGVHVGSRARSLAVMIAMAAGGAGLGLACGSSMSGSSMSRNSRSALPPAGSSGDDGTGFLARASTSAGMGGLRYGLGSLGVGGTSYGDARRYGGTRYGDYRFTGDPGNDALGPGWRRGHDSRYHAIDVVDGGAISGEVIWPHSAGASRPGRGMARAGAGPRADRTPADEPGGPSCSPPAPDETLIRDAAGHVSGAVVYLEGVTRGRHGLMASRFRIALAQLGGVLEHHRCRLVPRVQIVSPMGSILRLFGGDQPATQWTGTLGDRTLFRIPLGPGGEQRVRLDEAGWYQVQAAGDTAWVVVADHPYYTLSDDQGRFRLDEIPPGRYTLVVWHPPVAMPGRSGQPRPGAPITRRVPVTIRPHATTITRVRLSPSP